MFFFLVFTIINPPTTYHDSLSHEEELGDDGGHPPVHVDVVYHTLYERLIGGQRLQVGPFSEQRLKRQVNDTRSDLRDEEGSGMVSINTTTKIDSGDN